MSKEKGFEDLAHFLIPTGTFYVAALPNGKIRISFGSIVHEMTARRAMSLSRALRAFSGMALREECEARRAEKSKRVTQ